MVLAPGTVTIGRTKDNHIVCMHKSLSRKHAQLDFDGAKVRVADLQSKNGVFFNGRRVPTCNLVEGDSFRCGDITFLLEGAAEAQVGDELIALQAGDTLIVPALAPHAIRSTGDAATRTVLITH